MRTFTIFRHLNIHSPHFEGTEVVINRTKGHLPRECGIFERLLFSTFFLSTVAFAQIESPTSSSDFQAVKDAYSRGDTKTLEGLADRLDGQALQSYPQYWLLTNQIARAQLSSGDTTTSESLNTRIQEFLKRHAESPLAEQLRKDWLRTLGRNGDWGTFRNESMRLLTEDGEITCYALQERLARSDKSALDEAKSIWLADRETASACNTVFDELATAKLLNIDEVYDRVRRSFANWQVRDGLRAARYLPAGYQIDDASADRAQREPGKYLQKANIDAKRRNSIELALLAIHKLARSDANDAAIALTAYSNKFSAADQAFGWALVGTYAAQQHLPQANDWFKKSEPLSKNDQLKLNETLLSWRVRAALRAKDWPQVSYAINAMPDTVKRDSAWRYWFARAVAEQGKREDAQVFYRDVANELGFYGLMARDELITTPVTPVAANPTSAGATSPTLAIAATIIPTPVFQKINWSAAKPNDAEVERVRAIPGIQRAINLYRIGMRDEGFKEWTWALRFIGTPNTVTPGARNAPTDRDYNAAAEVARASNIPDRAIATALRTTNEHNFSLRFPTHHLDAAKSASERNRIELAWVYGIIRQESRFMQDVRSRAGAVGLMQLMPATAKWVAGKMQLGDFKTGQLIEPQTNMNLGAFYLKSVYTDLGDAVMATAAYNAGPGRAKRWRDEKALEGAIYAETIPFNETRDYVKQVFTNKMYYEERLSGKRLSMRTMMGVVPGRGTSIGTTTSLTDPASVGGGTSSSASTGATATIKN